MSSLFIYGASPPDSCDSGPERYFIGKYTVLSTLHRRHHHHQHSLLFVLISHSTLASEVHEIRFHNPQGTPFHIPPLFIVSPRLLLRLGLLQDSIHSGVENRGGGGGG